MNDTWTNNNEVMAWGSEDWQEALVALSTNRQTEYKAGHVKKLLETICFGQISLASFSFLLDSFVASDAWKSF
jgi:hypothetical protein